MFVFIYLGSGQLNISLTFFTMHVVFKGKQSPGEFEHFFLTIMAHVTMICLKKNVHILAKTI